VASTTGEHNQQADIGKFDHWQVLESKREIGFMVKKSEKVKSINSRMTLG
jgi:hypothetical protein